MKKGSQILWDSAEAAIVTGGTNTSDWLATGICVRAEDIQPGDLFVASEGESLDIALQKGAVAAIVSHVPDDQTHDLPMLKVASTFDALRDLARASRFRSHAIVLAVQGIQERQVLHKTFDALGHVYEGGKMLSLGMANLPEDYDFGVFALAPLVCPDIAVVSDPVQGVRDGLFESMPTGGTLIINSDNEDYIHVVARAQAAGLNSVLTYGRSAQADARILDVLDAENGVRVQASIAGEDVAFTVCSDIEGIGMVVASLLAAKLCGKEVQVGANVWNDVAPSFMDGLLKKDIPARSLSLFEALPGVKRNMANEAVFRVQNLIDLGRGRQTAVLDNLSFPEEPAIVSPKYDLEIPHRSANLDFVYTSKKVSPVKNARGLVQDMHAHATLEEIVPEVLAPGDFIIFQQKGKGKKATISEAIRMKTKANKKEKQDAL